MTSSVAQEIGQQLRDARLAKDLSLHDVADRLKLSLRQLEAIEAGKLDQLPGATFVRGFVRNYARFLALDSAPLMALLDQVYPPQRTERADVVPVAPVASARLKPVLWLLPVLAIAGLALWQWQSSTPAATPEGTLAPMQHQLASAAQPDLAQPGLASAAQASAPVTVPPVVVASAPPAVVTPQPAAQTSAAVPEAAGNKNLQLSVRADAWISVVDATGKRLVYGTLPAGSSRDLSGVPPFKLKIGNAPAVTLRYNNADVNLKDKTRGTTAKLELN